MDSTLEQTNSEYWNKRDFKVSSSQEVVRYLGCDEQPFATMDQMHYCTSPSDMTSAYKLSLALNKFPSALVINLGNPIRELFRDKMLGGLVSELMIIHCIEGVAMSLNDRIDYLDCMESSVEACVDALLREAAENGNLPPSETTTGPDGECMIKLALHSLMTDFCMRVRNIMMNQALPVVEVLGLPYHVVKIKSSGLVLFNKKDVDEIVRYIFD